MTAMPFQFSYQGVLLLSLIINCYSTSQSGMSGSLWSVILTFSPINVTDNQIEYMALILYLLAPAVLIPIFGPGIPCLSKPMSRSN